MDNEDQNRSGEQLGLDNPSGGNSTGTIQEILGEQEAERMRLMLDQGYQVSASPVMILSLRAAKALYRTLEYHYISYEDPEAHKVVTELRQFIELAEREPK